MATHPLSTEHNFSPIQLFTKGVLENLDSDYTGMDSFLNNEQEIQGYGVDDDQLPVEETDYQVTIPEINPVGLTEADISFIEQSVNTASTDGVTAYLQCIEIIEEMLTQ